MTIAEMTNVHLILRRMAPDVGQLTTLVAKGMGRRVSNGNVHYSSPVYPHELRADLENASRRVRDNVALVVKALSYRGVTPFLVPNRDAGWDVAGARSSTQGGTLTSIDRLISNYDTLLTIARTAQSGHEPATKARFSEQMLPCIGRFMTELRDICQWGRVSLEHDSVPTSVRSFAIPAPSAARRDVGFERLLDRNAKPGVDPIARAIDSARRCGLIHRVFERAHHPRQWSLLMLARQLPGDISDLATVFDKLGLFRASSVNRVPTEETLHDLVHEGVDFYLNVIWMSDHLHPRLLAEVDGGGATSLSRVAFARGEATDPLNTIDRLVSANATLIDAIANDDNAHLLLCSREHVGYGTSRTMWPALVEIARVIADLGQWANVSLIGSVDDVCEGVNAAMMNAVNRRAEMYGSMATVPPDATKLAEVRYESTIR